MGIAVIDEVERIANVLRARYGPGAVVGLSAGEVDEVRARQGVVKLPETYHRFLTVMGRRAGQMLAGTDIFYPEMLDLKDFLEDFPVVQALVSSGGESLVFGMHQGYQVYVAADVASADPPVLMYQEGDSGPVLEWESFTGFLRAELGRLG